MDISSDTNNCGGCGNSCPIYGICQGGQCGCDVGLTDCDGICANLDNSWFHCGDCDTSCEVGQNCVGGSCIGLEPEQGGIIETEQSGIIVG
ncbi:MAG: hypothetical protein KJ600_03770 [Nanoarchaeota archaeon]|nr:hypothetical protein [Nanoarchaeota archaeon]